MSKDIKLSNVKGLLIFLVVFGHLLSTYQENFNALYLLIYSFHMPLFVLISGYFAKRASMKKAANFIILYLIFQPLDRAYLSLFDVGKVFHVKYEKPYYQLWYLISMAVWYLIAVLVKKTSLKNVNKVFFVLGCFALGIASKYVTEPVVHMMKNLDPDFYSYTFSYQRTLSFLPFFFLGYYLTESHMKKIYQSLKAKWIITGASLMGIYGYFYFVDLTNKEKILKGSYGVYQMKGTLLQISIDILIGYVIAIVMSYLILNIMTRRTCILTKWGDHTLTIFLFHSFFRKYIKEFFHLGNLSHGIQFLLIFCMTIVILFILSSDWFERSTYYLSHPTEIYHKVARTFNTA